MKTLAATALAILATVASATDVSKISIVVEGKRYLYSDYWIAQAGGPQYRHVIVVHPDEPQFADVHLGYSEKKPWPAYLSTAAIEVPIAGEGVYVVRKDHERFRVTIVDHGSPQSEAKQQIEEYLSIILKRPNQAPEPTPGSVTPRANQSTPK